ncbi:hypothetical protein OE88DRAFT_1733288 [Heliocybe sulcata]|uniref:Pentacotripeptide-repeat region of PRORP domain-containing protein n=1 Tax=Heliocybe sulcata TaxID=5364 RepID=A0A5C3NBH3_9AGAM|nr:hypothetical protein OE88DRAFT_1733288 [Heliocybe sulcata]
MSLVQKASLQAGLRFFMRLGGCSGRPFTHRLASSAAVKAHKRLRGQVNTGGTARAGVGRINYALRSVERYLKSEGNGKRALGAFYLRVTSLEGSTAAMAHEKGILLFTEYECYEEAFSVYEVMTKKGLLPSPAMRARMLALGLALSLNSDEELLHGFQQIFTEGSLDERALREVLQYMEREIGVTHFTIMLLARMYRDARGKDFQFGSAMTNYLVYVYAVVHAAQGADEALEDYAEGQKQKGKLPEPGPYVARLDALLESGGYTGGDVDAILAMMERDGVEPDLYVFNTLIECEVRNQRYPKAFELYAYLLAHPNEKLRPDAFTFAHLFKAVWRLHQPRSAHTRRYKRPQDMPSPRLLFRTMMAGHYKAAKLTTSAPTSFVTTSILNLVLWTFLSACDYPGAFVAARAFRTCGVDPDQRTFSESFEILVRRIFREVRMPARHPKRIWMNRFLGYPLGPALKDSASEAEVLAMIIGIGKTPRLSVYSAEYRMPDLEEELRELIKDEVPGELSTVVQTEDGQKSEREEAEAETEGSETSPESEGSELFSLLASLGEDAPQQPDAFVPEQNPLNMTSLERIMRRAILADLPEGSEAQAAKAVSAVVVEAKREMIPPPREIFPDYLVRTRVRRNPDRGSS